VACTFVFLQSLIVESPRWKAACPRSKLRLVVIEFGSLCSVDWCSFYSEFVFLSFSVFFFFLPKRYSQVNFYTISSFFFFLSLRILKELLTNNIFNQSWYDCDFAFCIIFIFDLNLIKSGRRKFMWILWFDYK
jgi:hypothetical protein